MAFQDDTPDDNKPLDPAVERVRRKLMRFVFVNVALLMVALMAVVLALVYKSRTAAPTLPTPSSAPAVPSGEPVTADVAIPSGASVVSQTLDGDRLSVVLTLPSGGTSLLVIDVRSGQVVSRLRLVETP